MRGQRNQVADASRSQYNAGFIPGIDKLALKIRYHRLAVPSLLPEMANRFKTNTMKYLLTGLTGLVLLGLASFATAWDGFDAESADLVEIIPENVPTAGETINVKNHDTDQTELCLVENVKRNRRTIEIVVAYPDGKLHTLVMEGR